MRHRRKVRYSWFPVLGEEANSDVLPDSTFFSFVTGTLTPAPGSPGTVGPIDIVSLTWDYPTEVEEVVADSVPSLADFQGSEYQLERIVGKFHARMRQNPLEQGVVQFSYQLICAALMILRVDEKTGAPLRIAEVGAYSPLTSENIADPWMWRRSWILGNTGYANVGTDAIEVPSNVPSSTGGYSDIESGPHVDVRTVRRVRKEERVFLIVQGFFLDNFLQPVQPAEGVDVGPVDYLFDYRILGKLVKASARGNTSR